MIIKSKINKGAEIIFNGISTEISSIDQQMETSFDELRLARKSQMIVTIMTWSTQDPKPPSSNSNSTDASSLGDVCFTYN